MKKIFAEGGVIVVSILLALAADAWWDTVQDRRDEGEVYESLWGDLGALFSQARSARNDHLRYTHEITELLETLVLGEPLPADARTDSLVARAFFQYRTFDPSLEGVTATLERAEVLTNEDLKVALMSVPRRVADMTEEESVIGRELVRWARPVGAQTDVSHFFGIDSYRLQERFGLPPVPITGSRGTIIVTQEVLNSLHERLAYERFVVTGAENLIWLLDDIGWYLADELGRTRQNPERPHPRER